MTDITTMMTVGELKRFLEAYPEDIRIAVSEYYYDIQDGVVQGFPLRCAVLHNGVLYLDTNGVNTDKEGIPYHTLRDG